LIRPNSRNVVLVKMFWCYTAFAETE
jgi:hypothetical protein